MNVVMIAWVVSEVKCSLPVPWFPLKRRRIMPPFKGKRKESEHRLKPRQLARTPQPTNQNPTAGNREKNQRLDNGWRSKRNTTKASGKEANATHVGPPSEARVPGAQRKAVRHNAIVV